MDQAVVFISHIADERDIAHALKREVENSFLGLIDVFVSSDANSIKLGRKWLDNITAALKCCKVEIVIASPTSVKRPWVNFEAGAGWVRDIPVIPLCHSGMTPDALPTPLKHLWAALASDKDDLDRLATVLAEAIGSARPTIDWTAFVDAVLKYETVYECESENIQKLAERSPVPPTDGLLPHELAVLLLVGENVPSTDDGHSIWEIRNDMESAGYMKVAVGLAIASLTRKNLVAPCTVESGYDPAPGIRITDDGWSWLEENKERLSLIHPKKCAEKPAPPSTTDFVDEIPF